MTDQAALIVTAELHYRDPRAALEWLSWAFGFETRMVIADETGRVIFADIGLGSASFAITPEEPAHKLSPAGLNGANTQLVRIRGEFDVEAHCAKARAAGAMIVQEPTDFFFGDRVYVAADLEGHLWSFAQRTPGAGGPPPDGWTITFPAR
jgi:uncharacterized glyoxalase superfamily protein PhnB